MCMEDVLINRCTSVVRSAVTVDTTSAVKRDPNPYRIGLIVESHNGDSYLMFNTNPSVNSGYRVLQSVGFREFPYSIYGNQLQGSIRMVASAGSFLTELKELIFDEEMFLRIRRQYQTGILNNMFLPTVPPNTDESVYSR